MTQTRNSQPAVASGFSRTGGWIAIAVVMLVLGVGIIIAAAPQQKRPSPVTADTLMGSALHQEEVEGNIEAAIATYKKVIADARASRALKAIALLHLGRSYEKLGDAEARKAYERVAREFADQAESATTARTRLAALTRPGGPTNPSGVVVRQVWTGPEVDLLGGPSLDGRYLSYVDWETGDLAIRDLSTGENRRLTNRPPGEFAFYSRISPDGQKVAYVWVDKENPYHLRVTSINDVRDGVKPRVLFRNTPGYMEFGDWSPDGKSVLAGIRGIDLISAADGTMTTLKTLNWGRAWPRFSPDGRWIVYNVQPNPDVPDRDIFVLAADGSRETPLVEHPGDDFVLGWAPDGKRILFASDRSGVLSAWAIAVADGKPQGAPELVKPDIGNIEPMGFTRTGAFYYGLSIGLADVYVATLDPATGRVVIPPAPVSQRFQGRGSSPAWSADGQFIAYLSNRRTPVNLAVGPRVICIRSLKTGEERELSTPLSFEISYRLHWSPDGRFLLATATDGRGRGGLYRIDVQSGDVQPIVQGPHRGFRPLGVWSADGKAIIFYERNLGIRSRDLGTGQEVELYKAADESREFTQTLALSPDGRWLAFGDRGIVMIMSSAGGAPRERLRIRPDEGRLSGLEWAGDGKYLLFTIGAGGPSPNLTPELWRMAVDDGQRQKVEVAMQNAASRNAHSLTLAIHPDGRQIAFTAGETRQEVWVMENLLPPLKASR